MLFVDSSVWIDVHRGTVTEGTRFVDQRDDQEELATAGIILQEVLRGAREKRAYDTILRTFQAMLVLEHDALLVHNDRDFFHLSQVEPGLVIYPGRPH